MIILVNLARLAMVSWAVYALLLIFLPAVVHHVPDRIGGGIQFVAAYAVGWLMDRLLGVLRRRQAARVTAGTPVTDTGVI